LSQFGRGLRQSRRLTLITAPAGFGKTTLLSEWVTGLDCPVAWLSLDESDNDPLRVSAYIVTALRTLPGAEHSPAPLGEAFLAAVSATLDPRVASA
jgi:LuxR family maltose regulon positive regulatory protein